MRPTRLLVLLLLGAALLAGPAVAKVTLAERVAASAAQAPSKRSESARRPLPVRPAEPSGGQALPKISRNDPAFRIESKPPRSGHGTAFSIGSGLWVTARHVAWGCSDLVLSAGVGNLELARDRRVHDNADLARFRADVHAAGIRPRTEPLRVGQDGFNFSFPEGLPTAMRSSLIGRARMVARGAYRTDEPILAWARLRRVPQSTGTMQGASGSPVLDSHGRLIGVLAAESVRRGRTYSTAPVSMPGLIGDSEWPPALDEIAPRIDGDNFAAVGERLRHDVIVAKLYCVVD